MSRSLDVQDATVVYDCPMWRLSKQNIAVATGVTSDDRTVQGIGTSRWSGDSAIDAAVDDLQRKARATECSFRITVMEGGYANVRIEFLDQQGVYRTTGSTRGLTANKRVEITAERDGRSVSAEADESGFSLDNVGFGRRDWSDMLSDAIDSAASRFDKVGSVSLE
jgi:hypothetical protein